MPWPQKGAAHYHAQLGLPDKGYAIKGLAVCFVEWLRSIIYWMGLWISTRSVVWSFIVVSTATPHRFILINIIHTGKRRNRSSQS